MFVLTNYHQYAFNYHKICTLVKKKVTKQIYLFVNRFDFKYILVRTRRQSKKYIKLNNNCKLKRIII